IAVPAGALTPGFHFLAIRAKDASGRWGLYESRGFCVSEATTNAFDIVDAEYFFDADPGAGNGISIAVTPGATTSFSIPLPATGLTPGFHFLAIRSKSSDGKWGLFEGRGFYVSSQVTDAPDIVDAEYFFDGDPGAGNGIALSIPAGPAPGFTVPVNASGLPAGFHVLAIRTRDLDGKWSPFENRSFYVTKAVADVGDIIAAEYFFDSDPGQGLGFSLVVSPTDTLSETFAIEVPDTLSAGTHELFVRVQTSDGNWSIVEAEQFSVVTNSPPIADAGSDETITLPADSVTLDAAGSSDDGTVSFSWTMISGPSSPTLVSPNQQTTLVRDLVEGVYDFELTVVDNFSENDRDTVRITVNAPPNQIPIANAGVDQQITLPRDSVRLDAGNSIDVDGSIGSYSWTKISGPASGTVVNPANPVTDVTDLDAGTYLFVLAITDNNGAVDSDTVAVFVDPDPCPSAPVITQAGNMLVCDLTGVDYQWFMNSEAIAGATSQTLEITVYEYASYAVEVSVDGCARRSEDFVYLVTATEVMRNGLRIYPNPFQTELRVDVSSAYMNRNLTVVSPSGRIVAIYKISEDSLVIDTGNLASGIYYLVIDGLMPAKIIKY
ncbi:MAG TPA: T9SS type A sorting domain-containing protein, partial [Chryseosolibacter sp.]|nr:T9SS type A sorting domain-containing protein [Chryseosolibacter sp.]